MEQRVFNFDSLENMSNHLQEWIQTGWTIAHLAANHQGCIAVVEKPYALPQ